MKKLHASAYCALTIALAVTSITVIPTARADGAGAFIGGVMAARVGSNMRRRTEAEEEQAYYAQQQSQQSQQVQQTTAPAPAAKSADERLAELDQLAAKGYITPDEYKTRRESILGGL